MARELTGQRNRKKTPYIARYRSPKPGELEGIVIEVLGDGRFQVRTIDGRFWTCRIPGRLRHSRHKIQKESNVLIVPWATKELKADISWLNPW